MIGIENNSLTFPVKLKRIVDAPETDHLIYWDDDGASFHISDENQFAREVIPNYFKHSNISSFIRQLNMYGFHKINRMDSGLNRTDQEDSQWKHQYFIRDRPELLVNIIRKVPVPPFTSTSSSLWPYNDNKRYIDNNSSASSVASAKSDVVRLARAVQYLKKRDEETQNKLKAIQDENAQLYTEMMYLREEHAKQSKLIDLLVNFFSVCTSKAGIGQRVKPKRNLLALDLPSQRDESEPANKYFVTSPPSQTTASPNNLPPPPSYKLLSSSMNNRTIKLNPQSATTASNVKPNQTPIRKVIRITNFNDPSISTTTTNPLTNNSTGIPNNNNNKYLYTLSLPKQPSNSTQPPKLFKIQPIKAITAPPDIKSLSNNAIPNLSTNMDLIADDDTDLYLDDLLNDPSVNEQDTNTNGSIVTNDIVTDITSNVNSIGYGLNNIKKMLTLDNSSQSRPNSNNNIFLQSPIGNLNWNDGSNNNNNYNGSYDNEVEDPLKALWESIHNEELDGEFLQGSNKYPQQNTLTNNDNIDSITSPTSSLLNFTNPIIMEEDDNNPQNHNVEIAHDENGQQIISNSDHNHCLDTYNIDELLQTPDVQPNDIVILPYTDSSKKLN